MAAGVKYTDEGVGAPAPLSPAAAAAGVVPAGACAAAALSARGDAGFCPREVLWERVCSRQISGGGRAERWDRRVGRGPDELFRVCLGVKNTGPAAGGYEGTESTSDRVGGELNGCGASAWTIKKLT